MIEALVLGALQGILEWLPVSSEGALVLAQLHLFSQTDFAATVSYALFLHIGTMCAALVYFWYDIIALIDSFIRAPQQYMRNRESYFIIIASLGAAPIAVVLLSVLEAHSTALAQAGTIVTAAIGVALLITAALLRVRQHGTLRQVPSWCDGILTAIGQGIAVIPGISRSGTTTAILLLRRIETTQALRLSFLAGIPVMYGWGLWESATGNLAISEAHLLGLVVAFVFGLATIHVLLRLARRINFSALVAVFGLLTILAVLI